MDKTYAYFIVVGPGQAAAMTDHFGLEPSRSLDEGAPRVPGGSPLKQMQWIIDTDLTKDHPFEDHLEALLRKLEYCGKAPPKASISLRLDADVLDWFKSQGRGYQTRINVVVRAFKDASL